MWIKKALNYWGLNFFINKMTNKNFLIEIFSKVYFYIAVVGMFLALNWSRLGDIGSMLRLETTYILIQLMVAIVLGFLVALFIWCVVPFVKSFWNKIED